MPEVIRMTWEEWKASRESKREALRAAGLDFSSRRQQTLSTSDRRLRKAFDGKRAPDFAVEHTSSSIR